VTGVPCTVLTCAILHPAKAVINVNADNMDNIMETDLLILNAPFLFICYL